MINSANQLSLIPLSGVGDVTRNMYVYQYQNQILLVDCGLGFADETMLGIDLLIPDISYLQNAIKQGKKIVGMLITHGHEDHMGALPFILPQLPDFPIYATPLTAELANGKLQDFGVAKKVEIVPLESDHELHLGVFSAQFIRVTHSVVDTSHIFIRTPIGNFYHGSDFKIDPNPYDGKPTDKAKIMRLAKMGVVCLLSDCLGAEKKGTTPSEQPLTDFFYEEMKKAQGKFIVTTYSSNINRLNQVLTAAQKLGKRISFVGRSLINTMDVAKEMKLVNIPKGMEIRIDQIKQYKSNQLVLFVAGSQGQENSALTRIANNEHRDVKLSGLDTVVFSSDPIPGNEISVNTLIDSLLRLGCNVLYSSIAPTHVSGHGSSDELIELMQMVKPKKMLPIGGNFKHMVAYRKLAEANGYRKEDVFLPNDGQEIVFTQNGARLGQQFNVRKVYVDELSGEEVESYVLRDRQRLSQDGVVAIIAEIEGETGRLAQKPTVIVRGLSDTDTDTIIKVTQSELQRMFVKKATTNNLLYLRKQVGKTIEERLFRKYRKRPLILPIVIEV
ncbi:MAG TPA: ribonuclease J [Patescibacteria group bacterium]|nr:ribonuclease J [Patescibacteria group bacterium]